MNATSRRALPVRIGYALLWLFVFSMPTEKSVEIPGLGTISRFLGLLAMAGGVVAVLSQGRFRLPGPIQIWLTVFVSWSALTMRWTLSPDLTSMRIATFAQLLCLTWLVWELCVEERQVLGLLEAYVAGALIAAGQTLHSFVLGRQSFYNRYAAEGFDPNDLALTVALSIPMSYYLSLRRPGLRSWLYRLQMLAAIGVILLTGSRGGTLAMLTGLSLALWTLPALTARNRAATLVLLAAGLCAAVVLVPAASWKRIATLGSEIREGTLNSRTIIWSAGWEAFGKSPWQGVGSGAYPEVTVERLGRNTGTLLVAHNSHLSVLVETGLIGFVLFESALAMMVFTASRMPGVTRAFWCTLLAVWGIGVFSLTWEHRKPTWVIFALIASHSAAVARLVQVRVRPSAAPLPAWSYKERLV